MSAVTLLVIYNAAGGWSGHLSYAYSHFFPSPARDTGCSACEITHGKKLALSERKEWGEFKTRWSEGGSGSEKRSVRELHKEELTAEVSDGSSRWRTLCRTSVRATKIGFVIR